MSLMKMWDVLLLSTYHTYNYFEYLVVIANVETIYLTQVVSCKLIHIVFNMMYTCLGVHQSFLHENSIHFLEKIMMEQQYFLC